MRDNPLSGIVINVILMIHSIVSIGEEKYVVTDTFLSCCLHMTRSKSNRAFCESRVLRVLLKTGGEQKLVVWSWSDACIIA